MPWIWAQWWGTLDRKITSFVDHSFGNILWCFLRWFCFNTWITQHGVSSWLQHGGEKNKSMTIQMSWIYADLHWCRRSSHIKWGFSWELWTLHWVSISFCFCLSVEELERATFWTISYRKGGRCGSPRQFSRVCLLIRGLDILHPAP